MSNGLAKRLRDAADRAKREYPEVFRVSEEIAYEAADYINKLEAALLWYAEHCQKGGDDIEGPYGDYGQKARKALEGKDD